MMLEKNVTALVVDDDKSIQRMLAEMLGAEGFTVQVESDGAWAYKSFGKRKPDVVILDLLLPSMHGFEFARRIRMTPAGQKIPLIFITGAYKARAHEADSIRKYRVNAFLEKPLNLTKLKEALKEALGDRYPNRAFAEEDRAKIDAKPSEFFADDRAKEEVASVEKTSTRSSARKTIRGSLEDKSFAELMVDLIRWHSSGALLLKRDKVKKIVYFREGRPVSVKSNLLSECLGKLMVREKMISEAECQASLERMKATKRQQGTILIEMGCINPHNLNYALSLQISTKLFDIFSWATGEYQFTPDADVPAETSGLDMTPVELIYEGVKRGYDEARLESVLGDVGPLYVHPADDPLLRFQEVGLDEEETALLKVMDGTKSVTTLLALGILPPLETLRLIYALKCAQMITLRRDKASTPSSFDREEPPAPPPMVQRSMPPKLPPSLPPSMVPKAAPTAPSIAAKEPPAALESAQDDVDFTWGMTAKPLDEVLGFNNRTDSLMPELSGVFNLEAMSKDARSSRESLARTLSDMQKKDYFARLGVRPDAPLEKIKRAYFALAREYHPDKHFGGSSTESHRLAAEIYDLISIAHDTLADPEERFKYEEELKKNAMVAAPSTGSKALAAEGRFQRGEELFRQQNFNEALKMFQEAVNLCPDEGVFYAWLGWTAYQIARGDPSSVERSRQYLSRAIQLNPRYDQAHLFLGYIEKESCRPDRALAHFEHALQVNPDCIEALRELRLLGRAR